MKSTALLLAAYILAGSLMPGSDFSQLSRFSSGWQHYQLHRELLLNTGQQLSLAAFMADHFWTTGNHSHPDGGKSHQDLPLQSIHPFTQAPPVYVSLPGYWKTLLFDVPFSATAIPPGVWHRNAIFRPPIYS